MMTAEYHVTLQNIVTCMDPNYSSSCSIHIVLHSMCKYRILWLCITYEIFPLYTDLIAKLNNGRNISSRYKLVQKVLDRVYIRVKEEPTKYTPLSPECNVPDGRIILQFYVF